MCDVAAVGGGRGVAEDTPALRSLSEPTSAAEWIAFFAAVGHALFARAHFRRRMIAFFAVEGHALFALAERAHFRRRMNRLLCAR
jgi:hypothetical protein